MNKIINWSFAGVIILIGIFGLVFGCRDTLFVTVYWVRLSPAETAPLEQLIQVLVVKVRDWVEPYSGIGVWEEQPPQSVASPNNRSCDRIL